MILYGISTCDTCKKAIKALEAAGHPVTFRDVRKDPLSEAEIDRLLDPTNYLGIAPRFVDKVLEAGPRARETNA